jgi:hypothetical protein
MFTRVGCGLPPDLACERIRHDAGAARPRPQRARRLRRHASQRVAGSHLHPGEFQVRQLHLAARVVDVDAHEVARVVVVQDDAFGDLALSALGRSERSM